MKNIIITLLIILIVGISATQIPVKQQILVAQTTTSMVNQINTWNKLGYHVVSITSQNVSISLGGDYIREKQIRGDIIILMEK